MDMNEGRWDWNADDSEDPKVVEDALRRVVHDASRRRNTRRTLTGGGLAVLLIAAVGIGTLLDSTEKSTNEQVNLARSEAPAVPAPPASTTPGQTTATPPSRPSSSRPSTLVVTRNDNAGNGAVAVLDGTSGKQVRVIHSTTHRLGDISLSLDGKTAYFETFDIEFDGSSLWRVAVDGGGKASKLPMLGSNPRISPDGKRLAYFDFRNDIGCSVVIHDLATQQETRIANNDDTPAPKISLCSNGLAWKDNDHVVLSVNTFNADSYKHTIAQDTGLYIFDTRKAKQAITSGVKIPTSGVKADTIFDSPTVLPDGSVFAVERCCDPAATVPQAAWRMVVLDAGTGVAKRVVATGFPERLYRGTVTDASGNHLIYMSNDDVRVSDFGANPVVIATGVNAAAWR